jgi:plasmid stabilization system protein ParE
LEEDKPFNTINLLLSLCPILLWALLKEGVRINPHFKEEDALITCGSKEGNNSFSSKQMFYSKLDDYIEKDTGNIAWSTGEFGMLEDQKFLDALEARKPSTASIMGYVKGNLFKIDEFLDKFFEICVKEGRSLDKQTESKRRTQIKRLVENKKMSLFIAPHRLEGPHMAVIGESVYIQQQHVHNKGPEKVPVAVIFIRHPSENLKLFINDYLQELRESLQLTEVK